MREKVWEEIKHSQHTKVVTFFSKLKIYSFFYILLINMYDIKIFIVSVSLIFFDRLNTLLYILLINIYDIKIFIVSLIFFRQTGHLRSVGAQFLHTTRCEQGRKTISTKSLKHTLHLHLIWICWICISFSFLIRFSFNILLLFSSFF